MGSCKTKEIMEDSLMPLRLVGKDKIALKSADGKHTYIFCTYCNKIVKTSEKHFVGDLCLRKKKEFDKVKERAEAAIDYFRKCIFNASYRTFLSEKDIKEIEEEIEKIRDAILGKAWRIA